MMPLMQAGYKLTNPPTLETLAVGHIGVADALTWKPRRTSRVVTIDAANAQVASVRSR
jgi:hypothetical protein